MEEHTRFLGRLENDYDVPDVRYLEWLEVCYPKDTNTYMHQAFDETMKSDEGRLLFYSTFMCLLAVLYCTSILYLHVLYLDGSLSDNSRKTTKSIEGSFVFVLY